MRGGTGLRGYTIVETMIFLAVSGMMFIVAAVFVAGKQAKAEFKQGMNDINTQVQQVINDVSNGFYPSSANFTCTSSNGGGLSITSGTTSQGANGGTNINGTGNNGCVFMGKAIQFGSSNASVPAAAYNIYTIAGSQYAAGGAGPMLPTCFNRSGPSCTNDAEVTVVDPNSRGRPQVSLTDKKTFQWGLNVTDMFQCNVPGYLVSSGVSCSDKTSINALAFFTSFGSYNVDSTLNAGSQSIVAVEYTGPVNSSEQTAVDHINGTGGSSPATYIILPTQTNPSLDAIVCFDGGKGQYGTLTIGGGNGQRLATSIQIYSSITDWHSTGCI